MAEGRLFMSKEVFIEYVFDHTKESEGVFGEPEVPSKDKDLLASLLKKLPSLSEEEFVTMCIESIKESESFFSLLIRIRGLTLNKFLVDSSFKSKNSRVNVKKIIQQLIELEKIGFGTAHSLPLGEYFLEIVVRPLYWIMKGLVDGDPKGITNAILEITRYGFYRQRLAKIRGHYAEFSLAKMLEALDIPFYPKKKAEKSVTTDASKHGISFDLLIPDIEHTRIGVMSMVHTAHIGQYGEEKAKAVKEAKATLKEVEPDLKLVVFADGIGFRGNPRGLMTILENADYVIQYNSSWLLPALAVRELGLNKRLFVILKKNLSSMLEKEPYNSLIKDLPISIQVETEGKLPSQKKPFEAIFGSIWAE